MTDDELAELVARCGNIYTRFGLSPPMALRDAAKRWAGLSQETSPVWSRITYEAIVGFTSAASVMRTSAWCSRRSARRSSSSTRLVTMSTMSPSGRDVRQASWYSRDLHGRRLCGCD